MAGINKVIIVGHLGNEPEMRSMPNGEAVANIRGDLTKSNQQMIFGLHRKLIIDQKTKIKYRTFLHVAVN